MKNRRVEVKKRLTVTLFNPSDQSPLVINPADQSRGDDVQARMPEANVFTKGKKREEWVRKGKINNVVQTDFSLDAKYLFVAS